jgi:hypothetical protein
VLVLVRRVGVVVCAVHLERTNNNKPTKLFLFLKLSYILCKLKWKDTNINNLFDFRHTQFHKCLCRRRLAGSRDA